MANRLLMLGGGHAQLALLEAAPELIAAGHHLTLVSPDPVHYYSGMAPGLLGGSYEPEEIRFPIREMAEAAGVTFVRDRAVRIDPTERRVMLAGGETIEYNVLSVNTGSSIAPTVAVLTGEDTEAPRVLTAKPIAMMVEARRFVELVAPSRALRLVVVGGGPAAVEIALNLRRLLMKISPEADARSSVELFAGRSVLPGFPPRAERAVKRALAERGVSFRSSEHVVSVTKEGVHTRLGAESADLVMLATGVVPSRLFLDSGMPVGPDGSMAVNGSLQVLGHREIFGTGDCIWFTPKRLPRAGVFAVRESPVLVHNVRAALAGRYDQTKRFRPRGGYLLLLNFGDGTALFWRRVLGVHLVAHGAWAWTLKDRIDRSFMRRFGSEADRGNEY